MSDSIISIAQPAVPNGKLDAESVVNNSNVTVLRERMQLAGQLIAEIAKIKNAAPDSVDYGLVVRLLAESESTPLYVQETESGTPRITVSSDINVASGFSTTLNSDTISVNKTGKLKSLLVTSSVPFKAQVRSVSNGVASTDKAVWIASDTYGWNFIPPRKDFITVDYSPTAGDDCFRVIVTNLHVASPADFYATFMFIED